MDMIETKRLILRKFTLEDAEGYFRLNSNREVTRFTGDKPFGSIADAVQVLLNAPLRDYEVHGFGRLACVDKASGELIGFSGLKYLPEMDEVDLGYRFLPECWGRGYATESSVAVMDYGLETLGLKRIIGVVEPDNVASVKVLQKVGMRHEGKVTYGAEASDMDLYARQR